MFSRSLVLTFGSLAMASLGVSSSPVATTVEAQARYRFQEMDRNGDGVITRDEWRGSSRSFKVHERNLSYTQQAFNNLDHNHDGRLTPNEWHYDVETFRRIDRNGDNVITASESLGQDWDDDRGDNFDDLDYNNDGYVSRSEWHGGAREFDALDRNHDGRLSRYEVVGSNSSFNTYDQFSNLDYDRDGNLSRAEWHGSNRSSNEADANRDGVVSRSEFERYGTPGTIGALSGQNAQAIYRQLAAALDRYRIRCAAGRHHHLPVERADPDERQQQRRRRHSRRAQPPHGTRRAHQWRLCRRADRQDRVVSGIRNR